MKVSRRGFSFTVLGTTILPGDDSHGMAMDNTTTAGTEHIHTETALRNAYSHPPFEIWCPRRECGFTGSMNTCPYCSISLSDLSHWKWYSTAEPHPLETEDNE